MTHSLKAKAKQAAPATPMLDEMIDDMLHGDGIPRCAEWDRIQSFAATMEVDRAKLVAALRVATLIIGNVDHSKGNGANSAAMRGEMLNSLRDQFSEVLRQIEGAV